MSLRIIITGSILLAVAGCDAQTSRSEKGKVLVVTYEKTKYVSAESNEKQAQGDRNFTPGGPTAGNSGSDFPDVSFELLNLPTGKVDLEVLDLFVEADSSISHYAYKVVSSKSCDTGEGYDVNLIIDPLSVYLPFYDDGPLFICLLAYHFPSGKWMGLSDALVFPIEKETFKRSLSAVMMVEDANCGQLIAVRTQIELTGNDGFYNWVKDSKSQGCDQETEKGIGYINVTSNDEFALSGNWENRGTGESGWLEFSWINEERSKFEGRYGTGSPTTFGMEWSTAGELFDPLP